MGCHSLLQRIFPTQGLNLGLPYCRQILYSLNHQGGYNNIIVVLCQEATVRALHGTTDCFKIGKGVCKGVCIFSPCLFNFYTEYIMKNARLDESQAGIKISRRNIYNHRYADDTTLMAGSKEELKSLLMKVESGE